MSKSVRLAEYPAGTEYEELIAAHFQSKGFYIERNIIDRDVEEILELDVITTRYTEYVSEISIVEIKSGNWGFNEIFKLRGWLDYVKIENGLMIVQKVHEHQEFYEEKASLLNIEIKPFSNISDVSAFFKIDNKSKVDIAWWRYSYLLERKLLKYLKKMKRENLSMDCFKSIDKYYQKIKGGIFFTRNVSERLTALYDQYKEYPNLSGRTGNELVNGNFTEGKIPSNLFNETFYECKLNPIQVSSFVEYLSRLTILKNAIDFHLYELAGDEEKGDKIIFQTSGTKLSLLDFLPESFKCGIAHLSNQPYFKAYPIFWQWFIFLFGGFILLDYEEQEYNILSEKTGIPVEHINDALSVFDYLFPIDGGWFITQKKSNIKLLKTFPMPWRGIGANYRRVHFGKGQSGYSDLELSGKYTAADLSNWHNLGYEVLSVS